MTFRIASLATTFLVVLAASNFVSGQGPATKDRTPTYRLVDLGTFGGPASFFSNGLDGILNNHGTAVGWSNTSQADPYDPVCFNPNCFASHAFRSKNGFLTDLGTLPGGASSQANWISAKGLIAGLSQNGETDPMVPGFPELRAVLWRDDQIIDLGTLPDGGFESVANAVNNRGQVVGFALNTVPDAFSFFGFPTQTRAFLWQHGKMQDLGTLGGPDAIAGFINDQGEVSGPSYTAIDPAMGAPVAVHPFLWKEGTMIDLGSLGGTDSEPSGMNERGDVVGLSTLAGDAMSHPFLWTNGKLTDLGTLGGNNGNANWINESGDVVGRADLPGPAPQLHHGVLWSRGRTIDLGVLPGDACSNAYYVNDHGQVVGTSENGFLCSIAVGQHAFLREREGLMVDLNTLIVPGANLQVTYAVAINDRGEIAGFGVPPGCAPQDYESCGHAYVLIPCREGEACVNQSFASTTSTASAPLSSRINSRQTTGAQQGLNAAFRTKLHMPGHYSRHSD